MATGRPKEAGEAFTEGQNLNRGVNIAPNTLP